MSEKNLPIKLILQRSNDTVKNNPGGDVKYFGEVTKELREDLVEKFKKVEEYYADVFKENKNIPAVGKIIVKSEAIAKSHKPNDLCKNCPIIGSEDLNEIYIKVTPKGINKTIDIVKKSSSRKLEANLTTILDIQPIVAKEKISNSLLEKVKNNEFEMVKSRIKIKIFDFNDDYDNGIIENYIYSKLKEFNLDKNIKPIKYGDNINLLMVEVNKCSDIQRIASINGVKAIDFFQEYSLPLDEYGDKIMGDIKAEEYVDSDILIGIIDGGISLDNEYLAPYILHRDEYVNPKYQNPSHATFIASMIQYGNLLNNIDEQQKKRFKFVDIVAIPNSNKNFGPVDGINEEELMEIIEDSMEKYSDEVKIWNISLGIESLICNDCMSDLGIFLDYIQDKYNVQFFVSSGNLNSAPLRVWPPQHDMGERDRIISPADSVRAITVGSIALKESCNSIVKINQPSPFSRRGPGVNYIVKPDIVDYGGNNDVDYGLKGLGMKGMDINGNIIEGNGTSYANPRAVYKYSKIYDELVDKDLLLSKAMLIHSARMMSREMLEQNQDNIKYYGFGMPNINCQDVLMCSQEEVTLVFKQNLTQGTHLEMIDFPYPKSLIKNGKYYGEICMTLAYKPILNHRFGKEYCQTNIDVSFGTYNYNEDGTSKFKGQVPIETTWDGKFERAQVENGFKWSPIKSYYRKLKQGINVADGWKLRINMTPRNNVFIKPQEFVLIITIKDPNGNDIYTEIINQLREKGYLMNNLETKQQIRQRQ